MWPLKRPNVQERCEQHNFVSAYPTLARSCVTNLYDIVLPSRCVYASKLQVHSKLIIAALVVKEQKITGSHPGLVSVDAMW